MKIAFGTTLLDRGLSAGGIDGIGQYCQELLFQFRQSSDAPIVTPFAFGINPSASQAHLLPTYSQYALSSFTRLGNYPIFDQVDLIHSTDQLIPIQVKKPLVASIMDVIPLSHPQFIKSYSRYIKTFIWKKLSQQADRIITISEFSKNEIAKYLNFPFDKIDVIPLGVEQRYFELLNTDEKNCTLEKLGLKKPFFLVLGSVQPRKNLKRILAAHALLPQNLAQDYPLVIAGKFAWDDGKILSDIQVAINEGRCIWLKYVSEAEKISLLQSATGLIFASLYEGFGLPIIEAFASNLPVITSNSTAMPEVAGGAALLVNPLSIDEIRSALIELIDNPSAVARLQAAGLARAKQFSWQETAKQTISSYQKLI
jgi:alpha-1,3-rhamnosyl/mannosyltransferase